ncbi:MAG TPA: 1,4-alpha-glucan branching protein GlgB [Nitrospira sp.]|nr:1,4-alpha-glucan branching protein GlgB [Nitrospira sp.]
METSEHIARLIKAESWNPSEFLGPHRASINDTEAFVIRVFAPEASSVRIIPDTAGSKQIPMTRTHEAGLFETPLHASMKTVPYRVHITDSQGIVTERHDPYAFPPMISDHDLHLFSEGRLYKAYDLLGAHLRTVNGITGVHFVVWAPNARRASVIGSFNQWDGRLHQMNSRGATGLWELFIPDLTQDTLYKYDLLARNKPTSFLKADPYTFAAELRPSTASVVHDLSTYQWGDRDWMEARSHVDPLTTPMSIYEVHLGSWMRVPEEGGRWLTYRELADKLIQYVKHMGYTHIELMPITEHPFDGSWGYQATGYFAATSRYGSPEDFMAFIDTAHRAGIGVLIDWAPAHFPDDAHGLALFDGTHLYDHEDPRLGYHPEWNSRIFNYGRVEVTNFLLNSALFWLDKYHIDGLRVDAVASMLYRDYSRKAGEWIPNQFGGNENLEAVAFLKELNVLVHKEHPGAITIAEESTSWPGVSKPTYTGGLGFTFKWNMGWMHDMLSYFELDPIHRKHHQNQITFGLLYAFHENFVLVLSHDEVVHGKKSLLDKMPGDNWQRFANLRALYGYMYGHPGKIMLFMGGEFGQWREWNHDDSLQWHLCQDEPHLGLQRFVRDLNWLYRSEPALYEVDYDWTGFQWIDINDTENSVISFVRKAKNQNNQIICICNFTPVPRYGYRVGVPMPGWYRELLNSDAHMYGGSNLGNGGGVTAESVASHGLSHSIAVTLPPLSVLYFKAG